MACFDRGNLIGNRVSSEQPSVIDDPSIKNGFYGAPTVVCDLKCVIADAERVVAGAVAGFNYARERFEK